MQVCMSNFSAVHYNSYVCTGSGMCKHTLTAIGGPGAAVYCTKTPSSYKCILLILLPHLQKAVVWCGLCCEAL